MIIVIGVAANKCDLSNQAEVNEREGMEFAKQINAVFQETSASIDCDVMPACAALCPCSIVPLTACFLRCGFDF